MRSVDFDQFCPRQSAQNVLGRRTRYDVITGRMHYKSGYVNPRQCIRFVDCKHRSDAMSQNYFIDSGGGALDFVRCAVC